VLRRLFCVCLDVSFENITGTGRHVARNKLHADRVLCVCVNTSLLCVKTSLLRVDRPLLCFNTSLLGISPAKADKLPAANCALIGAYVCVC